MSLRSAILMLHRVVPEAELETRLLQKPDFEISVEFFNKYLFRLRDSYRFVSLDNLYSRLKHSSSSPIREPLLAVTFDDGYTDVLTHALPILEKYQIPFTIYLTTGYPDKRIIHISAAIEDWVRQASHIDLRVKSKVLSYDLTTLSQKSQAFQAIETALFTTYNTIEEIMNILPVNVAPYRSLGLNWEQVKELSENPLCTIGAHTITHPDLTMLSSVDLSRELLISKQRIEFYLKMGVRHFAYPYGRYNCSVVSMAEAAGYETMCTTMETSLSLDNIDFSRLPRACVVQNKFQIFSGSAL